MELESGATMTQIKLKYRELAKIWYSIMINIRHPDKNPGCIECKEKFGKIVNAYENLIDNLKRESYDSVFVLIKILVRKCI